MHGPLGQRVRVFVPVHRLEVSADRAKNGVGEAVVGEFDGPEPVFAAVVAIEQLPATRDREQLCTEANAEHRQVAFDGGRHQGAFTDESGMLLVVESVHCAAQHDEPLVGGRVPPGRSE